jgi:hypothetical protein
MGKVVPFDTYQRIKPALPGFGRPGFTEAYAEARAFMYVAERRLLGEFELTHLATRLSPHALSILREILLRTRHRNFNDPPT